MPSPSILFDRLDDRPQLGAVDEPVYFHDLNLDQVVASITAGRDEYDLRPFHASSAGPTSAASVAT